MELPKKFVNWAFEQRGKLVEKMLAGEDMAKEDLFLGFTRHTPAIITCGKNGPNGSIKGVGFLPQDDYIDELLAAYLKHVESPKDENYGKRGLELLHDMVWTKPEKFPMTRLCTIDMALDQTWRNIQENPRVSVLYYQPPVLSYEVKCGVNVHRAGSKIHQLVNAQHDVYHMPNTSVWEKRIVYEFTVKSIYDKSASKDGFGTLIWKR